MQVFLKKITNLLATTSFSKTSQRGKEFIMKILYLYLSLKNVEKKCQLLRKLPKPTPFLCDILFLRSEKPVENCHLMAIL
jgi:hypothetical protein